MNSTVVKALQSENQKKNVRKEIQQTEGNNFSTKSLPVFNLSDNSEGKNVKLSDPVILNSIVRVDSKQTRTDTDKIRVFDNNNTWTSGNNSSFIVTTTASASSRQIRSHGISLSGSIMTASYSNFVKRMNCDMSPVSLCTLHIMSILVVVLILGCILMYLLVLIEENFSSKYKSQGVVMVRKCVVQILENTDLWICVLEKDL